MAAKLKGITVEIGGNVEPLSKSLGQVDRIAGQFNTQLRSINQLLKMDPSNITLVAQKQEVLNDAVKITQKRFDSLNNLQEEISEKYAAGEIDKGEYRQFNTELEKTRQKLEGLKKQEKSFSFIGQEIKAVDQKTVELNAQLKATDKLLALDPNNITLVSQKQKILKDEVAETKDKLELLRLQQEKVKQMYAAGEIDKGAYRKFNTELQETKIKLNQLKDEKKSISIIGTAFSAAKEKAEEFKSKLVPLEEALEKVGNAGKKVMNGVGAAVSGAGKALAGYTTAVVGIGASTSGIASDLNEVQNVVDTTFKDSSDQINTWAQNASTAYGISELSAKQYTGTMGAMLKSMGMADDQTVKMSTSLAGLAGDLASFYNLETDEAFEKIRAGISGETEPLKQLGINMSVANLEAYALSQGISTAYKEMSQAEQTQLRYNYLMSVTADAQGDFAKTSDQVANQQRIAQQQIDSTRAAIGQGFLPVMQDTLKAFTGAMPQVNTAISGIFSGDTGAATQLTTGLTQMFTGMITNLSESLPNLLSSINQIVTSLLSALGAALPTLTSTLIPALISGLTGLVNAIIQQVPVLLPLLVEAALQLFTSLLTGLNEVLPTLLAMLPEIITKVSDTIIANLPMLIDAGIQLIVTLAQGLPKAIPALVEKLPEIISAIIDGLMSQDWLQIGIDILSGILDGLVAGIKKIPEAISKIGSSILNGFKSFFGIASPSKLMKKAVGFNLADGIGVGFVDEMERVNQEMQAALPRSFETEASVKVNGVLNTNPGGNGFDGSAGSLDNSVNQTVNIYANTPLSPAETARQLRNVNRQLARQIRSA